MIFTGKRKNKKKGVVYTLDATLSILIVIIAVMAVNGYFNRIAYNKLLLAHPNEISYDIMNVLQRDGVFDQYYIENEFFFNNTVMDKDGRNHGTYEGDAYITTRPDDYHNYWLVLDGNGDYLNISDGPNLNFGTNSDFTISAWIKTDSTSGTIVSKGDTAIENISLRVDGSGQIQASYGGYTITSSTTVDDGKWHHIAWTADRGVDQELYIDGNSEGFDTASSVSLSNPSPMLIGAENNSGSISDFFNGEIDNVQIFREYMDPPDIADLYDGESITTGLVAKYDFNVEVKSGDPKSMNSSLNRYLPKQYANIIRLDNGTTIIANGAAPDASSLSNLIISGERIVAIKKEGKIVDIMKIRYYGWTK